MNRSILEKISKDVASILGIEPVKVLICTAEDLRTPTMIGAMKIREGRKPVMLVKDGVKDEEQVLVVAHEMRHLWQAENRPDALEDYSASGEDKDIYNSQEAELDAMAFGAYYCRKSMGISPVLPLSNSIMEEINRRADEFEEVYGRDLRLL